MASGQESGAPTVSAAEERELRRVYDVLCDYHKKSVLKAKLHGRSPGATSSGVANGTRGMDPSEGLSQTPDAMALDAEGERTLQELRVVESDPDRKIKAIDVAHAMRVLGRHLPKRAIKASIWEVDENLDGMVDWDEFRLLFARNIADLTGLEPSSFYHLVQFMIYDQNGNGRVSVDETMNMLYARFGKNRMESKLRELFGEEMEETGTEGGDITFSDYLAAVERTQKRTFHANQERLSMSK